MRERGNTRPPGPLRDASYRGAEALGHGRGYRYPHDHPDGYVAQDYLPDDLVGTRFYEPTDHGAEAPCASDSPSCAAGTRGVDG